MIHLSQFKCEKVIVCTIKTFQSTDKKMASISRRKTQHHFPSYVVFGLNQSR